MINDSGEKDDLYFPTHLNEMHEFIDDIIFEILQFLESLFVIQVCMKISTQWRQVSFQIPLKLSFK